MISKNATCEHPCQPSITRLDINETKAPAAHLFRLPLTATLHSPLPLSPASRRTILDL